MSFRKFSGLLGGIASSSIVIGQLAGPVAFADSAPVYSMPDQPARFAKAKKEKNDRFLHIEKMYNPKFLKGKVVLVTGGNRGLGRAIVDELIANGAKVVVTTRASCVIPGAHQVISGIELTDNKCGAALVKALNGQKIDIVINNAGYFYKPVETLSTLNFEEEMKMIDICAVAPLRITSALVNGQLLTSGAKIAMITSQGGSISWRTTQNPNGQDYGHHMSKAAANMMGALVAQELKDKDYPVSILHPGFNKTEMTSKYAHIWEVEGAVDSSVGAKRVIHEIGQMNMSNTGKFINCEDGLQIPW